VKTMTIKQRVTSTPDSSSRPLRRRRWWWWTAGALLALLLVIVLGVAAFIKLQPTAAPLTLPAGKASPPAGVLPGTWRVTAGSMAGFRVQERALGLSNYTVGRTGAVTGIAVIAGDSMTSATVRVNLTEIRVGGKTSSQFASSLDTSSHPVAVITLTHAVPLTSGFVSGLTVRVRAAAELTLNGASRPVTVMFTARRDGALIQAAGSLPVTFATWRVSQPQGFGFLGSLASNGTAEFLLILRRA
jgi:polyisoprenoid-binding protein YceI